MLFNSLTFVEFFGLFYVFYLLLRRQARAQTALLFAGSYVFYGWWDWRFLSLLALSTGVDFAVARVLGATPIEARGRRRRLLLISLTVNLGVLCAFKYLDFFARSFGELLRLVGFEADPITLNLVLPVGISFYTFQTLAYTIDVYRGRIEPTRSLLEFGVFVAYFPQLVAGPIERASHLLPQLAAPRRITWPQVDAGLYLILWGYFKKVVVADNAGRVANAVFGTNGAVTGAEGLDVVLGTLAFSIQIYGDFSGYSDIARGLSRLLGIELSVNFRRPWFALNPSDFWQRWHVTLSSWLRDYLYIPLGGNRRGAARTQVNLLATMLLGGLWHGAAWTFVLWGAFHGVLLVLYRRFEDRPAHAVPNAWPMLLAKLMLMTVLTQIGWLLFRATSATQAWHLLTSASLAATPRSGTFAAELVMVASPLLLAELYMEWRRDSLVLARLPVLPRALFYGLVLAMIAILGERESMEFIYFQF